MLAELFTAISDCDGSKCDQPWMVPSSVANRNREVQLSIWNWFEPLYTSPVGEPGPLPQLFVAVVAKYGDDRQNQQAERA